MKFVINSCYGGFLLKDNFLKRYPEYNHSNYPDSFEIRSDPEFIRKLEEFGVDEFNNAPGCAFSFSTTKLKIVEIPDEATDYKLIEYDGREKILYVIDGKIKEVY